MHIAILILAAGSSSRMGVAKQLLPVGDKTLLGISIENAINSKISDIYCVLGANAEVIQANLNHYNIQFIINSEYKTGLSSSIKKGIRHLQSRHYDAILMILADQPFVDAFILNKMINSHKNEPNKIVASSYGENLGIPVVIPKLYYSEFLKIKGDNGAKSFLNKNKSEIIRFKNENLIDIDTEDDYETYLKSIN
ncbi:nucleotidyltransferase family protein [Winogradskyella flava]|uniref:nucleotidyltransferase family protein n=1 Tax=Winogradskyella flava TaxID=1884876 RepID=UPI00248F5904|nr:nucleotidyltransferase family protein [Winogradskyella flava]